MFYSRQVEVIPEGPYVRWITNHVLRESEKEEIIRPTRRKLTRILNADSKGLNLFGEIVTGY